MSNAQAVKWKKPLLSAIKNQPEFWEYINLYDIEKLLLILENNLTDDQQYNSPYEIEKKTPRKK